MVDSRYDSRSRERQPQRQPKKKVPDEFPNERLHYPNEYVDLNFYRFSEDSQYNDHYINNNSQAYNDYKERKSRNNRRDGVNTGRRELSVEEKALNRRRANSHYHTKKAQTLRQRILNNVEDGGCPLDSTMLDENNFYNWTPEEQAMFEKCKKLRRDRYVVPPQDINLVVDDRYRRPYPYKNEVINNILLKNMTDYHLDITKFKWRNKLKALGRKPFEVYVQPNPYSLYSAYLKTVDYHATSSAIDRLQHDVHQVMISEQFKPIKDEYLGVSTASDRIEDADVYNDEMNADAAYDWNEALLDIIRNPSHIHIRALAISIGKPIIVITMNDKHFYPGYRFDLRQFIQVFHNNYDSRNVFQEDIDYIIDRMKSTITCYDLLEWTKIKDELYYERNNR